MPPGSAASDQRDGGTELHAVAVAAMILAPPRLLGVAAQVQAGDVVVMADLGPADTAEEALRLIGAGVVAGILDGVVDALGLEARVQRVPGTGLVGMHGAGAVDRALMKSSAASSVLKTLAIVRPRDVPSGARSRTTTTHCRLPVWFSARRRSRRSCLRFSGRTWPPK